MMAKLLYVKNRTTNERKKKVKKMMLSKPAKIQTHRMLLKLTANFRSIVG